MSQISQWWLSFLEGGSMTNDGTGIASKITMSDERIRELALAFTLCKVRRDGKKMGPLPLRALGVTPEELGITSEEFDVFERDVNKLLFVADFGSEAILVKAPIGQIYVPTYADKDDPVGTHYVS